MPLSSLATTLSEWILARQAVERLPHPRDDDPVEILSGHYEDWLAANQIEVQLQRALNAWTNTDIEALFQERGVPAAMVKRFFWRRQHWQDEFSEHHFDNGARLFGATLYIPTAVFDWVHGPMPRLPMIPQFVQELEDRLRPLFRAIVTRNTAMAHHMPILLSVGLLDNQGWPNRPYMQWNGIEINNRVPPPTTTTLHGCLISLPLEAHSPADLATLEDLVRAVVDQILKEDWGHFKYMGQATHREEALEEASIGMGTLWARQVMGASARQRGEVEFVVSHGERSQMRATVRIKEFDSDQVVAMFNLGLVLHHRASVPRVLAPWFTSGANHLSFQLSVTQTTDLKPGHPTLS